MVLRNLNGGPALDKWTLERVFGVGPKGIWRATQEAALTYIDGVVIYQAPGGFHLHVINVPPESTVLAPPTDAATWRAFGQAVRSVPPSNTIPAIDAWASLLPGPTVQGNGRILRVTVVSGGLHIWMVPGRLTADAIPGLNLRSGAGLWEVSYRDHGGWSATPATYASLRLTLPRLLTLEARRQSTVPVVVRNTGDMPWTGVVSLSGMFGPISHAVTIPGKTRLIVDISVTPRAGGEGEVVAHAGTQTAVAKVRVAPFSRPTTVFESVEYRLVASAWGLILATFVGMLWARALRAQGMRS